MSGVGADPMPPSDHVVASRYLPLISARRCQARTALTDVSNPVRAAVDTLISCRRRRAAVDSAIEGPWLRVEQVASREAPSIGGRMPPRPPSIVSSRPGVPGVAAAQDVSSPAVSVGACGGATRQHNAATSRRAALVLGQRWASSIWLRVSVRSEKDEILDLRSGRGALAPRLPEDSITGPEREQAVARLAKAAREGQESHCPSTRAPLRHRTGCCRRVPHGPPSFRHASGHRQRRKDRVVALAPGDVALPTPRTTCRLARIPVDHVIAGAAIESGSFPASPKRRRRRAHRSGPRVQRKQERVRSAGGRDSDFGRAVERISGGNVSW